MRVIAAGMGLGMLLAGASAWTQSNPQHKPSLRRKPSPTLRPRTTPPFTARTSSPPTAAATTPAYLRRRLQLQGRVHPPRLCLYQQRVPAKAFTLAIATPSFARKKIPIDVQWFKWQDKLMKAMGTFYKDVGQLKVVNVQPNVSTAEVTFVCDYSAARRF